MKSHAVRSSQREMAEQSEPKEINGRYSSGIEVGAGDISIDNVRYSQIRQATWPNTEKRHYIEERSCSFTDKLLI